MCTFLRTAGVLPSLDACENVHGPAATVFIMEKMEELIAACCLKALRHTTMKCTTFTSSAQIQQRSESFKPTIPNFGIVHCAESNIQPIYREKSTLCVCVRMCVG